MLLGQLAVKRERLAVSTGRVYGLIIGLIIVAELGTSH